MIVYIQHCRVALQFVVLWLWGLDSRFQHTQWAPYQHPLHPGLCTSPVGCCWRGVRVPGDARDDQQGILSWRSFALPTTGAECFARMILAMRLQDWPSKWQSFIPDLVAASKTNETLCENSMHILKLLSEEIFDFSQGELTQVHRGGHVPVCDNVTAHVAGPAVAIFGVASACRREGFGSAKPPMHASGCSSRGLA